MKKIKKTKGFTLVELLIVIAIIGVLASLLMPAVTSALGQGDRITAKNNARSIAQSWKTYSSSGARNMIAAKDIHDWAAILAERADLNEAKIWLLPFDLAVAEKTAEGAPVPLTVANKVGNNWQLNPEFKAFPVSWEVANRAEPNAPSYSPIVWSRGLRANGMWDMTGVFKDAGGIMAFADSRVEFYPSMLDDNGQGILRVYGGTERTSNIARAVRNGSANILKSEIEVYDEEF